MTCVYALLLYSQWDRGLFRSTLVHIFFFFFSFFDFGANLYNPVTYISMPSLKVKMVVVLMALAPCFASPMAS